MLRNLFLMLFMNISCLGYAQNHKNLTTNEFEKAIKDKNVVVLDVRTDAEFKAGHLPNAQSIDVNGADFSQKIAKLDKNKAYYVYCKSGVRSTKACNALTSLGFKKIHNLENGFKDWQAAGKKVVK